MPVIVPLALKHAGEVATLHLRHLHTPFRGKAGYHLLSSYYATVAEGVGAFGYVAEIDQWVAGYVCGIWDPRELHTTLLKRHFFTLVFFGSALVVSHPSLLGSLISKLGGTRYELGAGNVGYELRPIVIDPALRGTGVAASLVEALLADADRRGFQQVHLLTEANNLPANAFYHKVGFLPTGALHRFGEDYVRYERSV